MCVHARVLVCVRARACFAKAQSVHQTKRRHTSQHQTHRPVISSRQINSLSPCSQPQANGWYLCANAEPRRSGKTAVHEQRVNELAASPPRAALPSLRHQARAVAEGKGTKRREAEETDIKGSPICRAPQHNHCQGHAN